MRKLRIRLKKFIWFFRFIRKYNQLKEERRQYIQVKLPKHKKELKQLREQVQERNQTIKELRDLSNALRLERDKASDKNVVLEKQLEDLTLLVDTKFVDEHRKNTDKPCNKQRCCDRQEAKEFAYKVRARTGQGFVPYECSICPVNKRTGKKIWHITHKERFLRGLYGPANLQ